jgi:two-component system sensor histidine kinase/response regulator
MSAATADAPDDERTIQSERSMTILVVDDNLQNREVAEGHLVAAGYSVVQAESGEQALPLVESQRPDLILLDVLMPGMDGFETCRSIRLLPGVGDTPILFLTALGDLSTHKAALDSGADDFLTKPINRTELLIRVRSLLRIKQLGDELKRNYDIIRSQRDALLAAQREKQELTALIVHDLKNPLSSILSNAHYVLGRESLHEEDREAMTDIGRASQSMMRLVMNLLDVSRSEDGALVPHVVDFDLPVLVREICSEMGRRVEDNAYKYGPRQATITVELAPARMEDGVEPAVELRVRDEGDGIPAAYHQLIFEKYGRFDGGAPESRTSHGLGLVFCRRAVAVHGGAIWVEDGAGGRGGCFCVRLPIARLPLAVASAPTPPRGWPGHSRNPQAGSEPPAADSGLRAGLPLRR